MDTEESSRRQEQEIKQVFGKVNPSWDEIRKFIKDLFQSTLELFDRRINSRWTWGKNKRYLIAIRSLLSMNGRIQGQILDLCENQEQIAKAVDLFGKEIEKTHEKSKELEDTLTKIKNVFAEPRIAKVASIMEQIEKQIEESKKASGAYSV